MAFWVVLIKIAKILMTVKKYAALLSSISSGKLVESIIGDLIVGKVTNALVKAGIPINHFDFVNEAQKWIIEIVDKSAGDLAKHGIVLGPDLIHQALKVEVERLLTGKSIAGGKTPVRNQRRVADPVLLHNGEFEWNSVDLFLKGAGLDLVFRRVYRSGADFIGPFGRGWDHSFNLRIIETNAIILTRLTGNLSLEKFVKHPKFGQAGYSYFSPQDGVHDILTPTVSGSYLLSRPGGAIIEFEACGPSEHRALSIRDISGNSLNFEYDSDNRLQSIFANSKWRFIRFTYDMHNRIINIADHSNRGCTYEYDEFGFLSACFQWIETRGRPNLNAEIYKYQNVGGRSQLTHISDEIDQPIVENVYDSRKTSDTFGYVIEQITKAGPTYFIYEFLDTKSVVDLPEVDQPTLRVFETGPDGHVIERIFNNTGNELIRREDFTDGQRRRVALIRNRYNPDGAVITRMDPEGGLTQYLLGREHADPALKWSIGEVTLLDITEQERMSFGNQLAKVERGTRLNDMVISWEQAEWIAILPSVKLRVSEDDAIIKYVYHPVTQLIISESDPRYTQSPDPFHVESAPVGTVNYNPAHALAIAHRRHQTQFEYTTLGVLSRKKYPDRIRPLSFIGATILSNIAERVLKTDSKGRPMERMDCNGYISYLYYYPQGATPADNAREGFLKQELMPHSDWILNEDIPDILEIQRKGSWIGTSTSLISLGTDFASIEIQVEAVRVEIWQAFDLTMMSNHTAVTVTVDSVFYGSWNQTRDMSYVINGLSRGIHVIRLQGAYLGPYAIGRVLTHVAIDYEIDAVGRVFREIDGRGIPMETEFDTLDRVVTSSRGSGVAKTLIHTEFNRDNQLVTEETVWGDANGYPVAGGSILSRKIYNAMGFIAREVKGSSNQTEIRITRYYYDQRGQLLGTKNGRGVLTRFRYDALGRCISLTRAACTPDYSTTTSRFDRCGRLLSERNAVGSQHVMGQILPSGAVKSGYDSRGRLRVTTDPRGHVTVTQYDVSCREIVSSRFGLQVDGAFKLVYRLETIRDEHGDVIKTFLALISEPIITADPYDSPDFEFLTAKNNGQVSEAVTYYELDAYGRQTKILDPRGGLIERRYDPQGRLAEERLPSGRRTVRIYDATGNLTRIYAFENSRAATEGINGISVFMEEYEYDSLGRKTIYRDAFGNEWRYTYDTVGNLTSSQAPLGSKTELEHNAFGEVIALTEGLSSNTGSIPAKTRKKYDRVGNLVLVVDALGREFSFSYDSLNRVILSKNLSFVNDPGCFYEYDRADNLIREINRNGIIQIHTYDTAGHRIRTDFDWSTVKGDAIPSLLSSTFITMEYDALGNLSKHENDSVSVMIRRDCRGLVLEEATFLKPVHGLTSSSWRVSQVFNEAGDRTNLTFPSGRIVAYLYDESGRVKLINNIFTPLTYTGSALTSGSNELVKFEYAGQRWCRTVFPKADAIVTAKYEGRGQICEYEVSSNTSGEAIWRAQVFLDAARRVALETAFVQDGSRSRYFHLDSHDRNIGYVDGPAVWANISSLMPPTHPRNLTASTEQSFINTLIQAKDIPLTFSYDLVGNRLNTSEPGLLPFSSVPDPDNRYTTVGDNSWKYDNEGQLLFDGDISFRYDAAGLLSEEISRTAGSIVREAGLIRDAVGRVVAVISANDIHYFVYSGRTPIAWVGTSRLIEFTPGRFADEPIHMASDDHDNWIINDRLRSPRLLLKRGANPSNTIFNFRPFGAHESASSAAALFGFAGMLRLPGSSVLHASLRSYRSDVGRYLQQDPAGLVDGPNRYIYVSNNPMNLFDPLGLQGLTASDDRILGYLEQIGADLNVDQTHKALSPSARGSNKHLEMQFLASYVPESALPTEDAMRIAPEIWVDDKGIIIAVDAPPNGAPKNARTVDIAVVKSDIPGGRNSILGHKAEDVLSYTIDYKTGNATLKDRKELEALLGYKPVVKLTGKKGELARALLPRFKFLQTLKTLKHTGTKEILKNTAKWGLKHGIPVISAFFSYSTAEASQSEGEKIARAVAGEIGLGPLDAETIFDWTLMTQEAHDAIDPDAPKLGERYFYRHF